MKRTLLTVLISTVLALSTLTFAGPAAADPTSTCPDGHIPVPAALVDNGAKRDKNGNGIVCGKAAADGTFHGGPDDDVTDDILL
jgi:hypothetical protein